MSTLHNPPKYDPHVHLEGTVSTTTLQELAARNKVDLNAPTLLSPSFEIAAPKSELLKAPFAGSFWEFISLYLKISDCITNAEDLLLVGERYLASDRTDGVSAADIYVTPSTLLRLKLNKEELFSGLSQIERLASAQHDFKINWIFDLVRGVSRPGEETVELATEFRDRGLAVNYIGLAGLEANNPAAPFRAAFDLARDRGFRILAHAGETAGAESIWETISAAKPERIGHGIRAIDDPQLLSFIKHEGIQLEVSPWSNILLGVCSEAEHPLPKLRDAGLQILICSDDPGIFGKSLRDNYDLSLRLN